MNVLGIDIGTTTISAVVYNEDQGVLAAKTVKNNSFLTGERWEKIQDPNMIYETAPDYIQKHYPDSKMIFAKDYDENGDFVEDYYTTLGGRDTYPYTVILDENGVIVKIFFDSVEYQDLKTVVEEQLN